ncbi:MAG: multicopper oxidase domain-containing protein [Planctomycetia bacterium]
MLKRSSPPRLCTIDRQIGRRAGKDAPRRPASRRRFGLVSLEALEPRAMFNCDTGMAMDQPTLDPMSIHKYVTPLPNLLDPKSIFTPTFTRTGTKYDIGMYETTSNILGVVDVKDANGKVVGTTSFQTDIYGYGTSQATASFPAKSIQVRSGTPIQVHWTNNLGSQDSYLMSQFMDMSPGMLTPDMMAMPANDGIPTVPHLHGGHTEAASDGTPNQWFTGALPETPGGKPVIDRGIDATKANDTFVYANDQRAATLWYHDHAMGFTRTNVYAGLMGMYIVRDEVDTGLKNNPAGLPSGAYEIPLAIADRMFTEAGQLYYPHQTDNTGCTRMLPEAFGDVMTVNGKAWPVQHVEPRNYRFRMVNASDSRFLDLWLSKDNDPNQAPAAKLMQVGSDQGLLSKPAAMDKLLFGPGERADVVVDFSKFAPGTRIILRNDAATPYSGGDPVDPDTTGQVMEFIVDAPLNKSYPNPALKSTLVPAIKPLVADAPAFKVGLFEMDTMESNPAAPDPGAANEPFTVITPMLGTLKDGPLAFSAPVTEKIQVGKTVVWEIYNTTEDVHPVHIHLAAFQVQNRQDFTTSIDVKTGATIYTPTGAIQKPQANELGWKDTVLVYPGQMTRVVAKYDRKGDYIWHCHIMSHEESDMMRKFSVVDKLTTTPTKSSSSTMHSMAMMATPMAAAMPATAPMTVASMPTAGAAPAPTAVLRSAAAAIVMKDPLLTTTPPRARLFAALGKMTSTVKS